MGERLPGIGGQTGNVVEQASKRLLCYSGAGVEVGRDLSEETAEEPGLTGAHEASDDGHHIPQIQTAGLQSLVYDLLSSLVRHHQRI